LKNALLFNLCCRPKFGGRRGAIANIKPMPNRKEKPAFDKVLYRLRNKIERFFNKLKQFRAIATWIMTEKMTTSSHQLLQLGS